MIKRIVIVMGMALSMVSGGEIVIAVAANVSYAMKPLLEAFAKTHPTTKVSVVLGSSGKLTAQILHGAPYALLLSANMRYPQRLYEAGVAVSQPRVYAQGALAYLSRTPRDFSQGMALLDSKQIHKIAIANPKTAPYGEASREAMERSGCYATLREKLVFGESIAQTVSYTIRATDIGIIAKSSLYSPQMSAYQEGVHWASVDPHLYTPIKQGIVILKQGAKSPEVKAFYAFMLSPPAQTILRRFGYLLP